MGAAHWISCMKYCFANVFFFLPDFDVKRVENVAKSKAQKELISNATATATLVLYLSGLNMMAAIFFIYNSTFLQGRLNRQINCTDR